VTLRKLFLADQSILKKFNFSYLKSSIFGIDNFTVKEYYPLINSRVHDLSNRSNNIRDKDFKKTYLDFLTYVSEKNHPSNEDNLLLSVYLLLQDRIDESLDRFNLISPTQFTKG